ncbi:MAG: FmdB family zinc ribbon protein [Bacillota bacterium]
MPLYEFYCSECEKKHEELCSSTINSVQCPSCGKDAKKVLSLFRTGRSSSGGGTTSSSCGG